MKTFILALLPLVLTGCTITKQAQVSEASAITGVVRLTYNQAMLQTARTDDYVTQGTATKECQRLGYANAEAFGQPYCLHLSLFSCSNPYYRKSSTKSQGKQDFPRLFMHFP